MSIIDLCKRNTLSHTLVLCIITLFCLSACGFSGDRNGTGGRTSTNNNSNGNTNEDETGIFQVKEKIGIRVERINGNVNGVDASQISIVSLNENFNEIGGNAPDYRVLPRDTGGYEIQFSSSYVEKLNQVVKVTFQTTPVTEFLYAPLYTVNSDTESITVSVKSHYLLKKVFDAVTSETQLNNLLPCSGSETECANQPMAKSNFLEQVNIAVSAYHVDLPENTTITQAMSTLDQRQDLKQHIESAVNEITRTVSPFAKGTRRSFNLSTVGLFTPNTYHSLLFGLSFSDFKPDDSFRSVKINSFSSAIIEANTFDDNVKPIYPSFSQTTSMLDMRRDVMSTDIPFKRTSLEIAQNNSFSLIENEELNALTSNLTDSFLSTEGFLLNERVIDQTIPGEKTDPKDIGWEFEPVFSRIYQVNEYEPPTDNTSTIPPEPDYGNAATWLVTSNYSKTASYSLSDEETNQAEDRRIEQLEDSHLFTWEVHGLQVDKDDDFSTSEMNGKEYGAISYSLKLNDEDDTNVLRVIAETAKWDINSSQIIMSQPSSFFRTYSLSRADDNATLGVRIESNLLDSPRSITTIQTNDSNGFSEQGLISFGGQQAGKPQGHSSANGSYLAFVFNTLDKSDALDRGQGIILATELSDFTYEFSGESYQLQGNSFEITDEKNILHQLNGSSLVITDNTLTDPVDVACHGVLSIKRTSVEHTVGTQENTLSDPLESEQSNISSDACSINRSQLQLEFTNVFGEDLTLRGFITQKNDSNSDDPGNLINLIWQQDNQLGLVFANKDQELSPTFDD